MLKKFYLECYHNTNKMSSKPNFAYFGTSEFSVKILEKLIENGYVPSLVVTATDKPKGRKMILTPPPIKFSPKSQNQKTPQPEGWGVKPPLGGLTAKWFDLFIVASYGKI